MGLFFEVAHGVLVLVIVVDLLDRFGVGEEARVSFSSAGEFEVIVFVFGEVFEVSVVAVAFFENVVVLVLLFVELFFYLVSSRFPLQIDQFFPRNVDRLFASVARKARLLGTDRQLHPLDFYDFGFAQKTVANSLRFKAPDHNLKVAQNVQVLQFVIDLFVTNAASLPV